MRIVPWIVLCCTFCAVLSAETHTEDSSRRTADSIVPPSFWTFLDDNFHIPLTRAKEQFEQRLSAAMAGSAMNEEELGRMVAQMMGTVNEIQIEEIVDKAIPLASGTTPEAALYRGLLWGAKILSELLPETTAKIAEKLRSQ